MGQRWGWRGTITVDAGASGERWDLTIILGQVHVYMYIHMHSVSHGAYYTSNVYVHLFPVDES